MFFETIIGHHSGDVEEARVAAAGAWAQVPSEPAPPRLADPGVGSLSAEAAPCVGTALSETVPAALSRLLSPCLGTAEGDADERHGVSSA